MSRVFILLSIVLVSIYQTEQAHFLTDDYINQINNEATTWKAGKNFHSDTPVEYFKSMLGSKGVGSSSNGPVKTADPNYENIQYIPRTFDARKKWKNCQTVGHIRDQGQCGSCWAHSTTSAFSDRLCIATDGKFNQLLSVDQLTFCCYYCGFQCLGGWPIQAWRYFKHHGIVTGGDYGTHEGCKPYRVPPSNDYKRTSIMVSTQPDLIDPATVTESPELSTTTEQEPEEKHSCKHECDGDTSISYKDNIFYTRDAYHLTPAMIQKDVLAYGPVEASFKVYDDFINYKSGVYVKTENATYMGAGHSVKLIGWGVERGVPYWLMVNSWNYHWGDWGTFKIRRGTNECEIEDSVTGGVPLTY
ncbi:cathepsin B-like [Adelges cooleyi]|uniref:cathepsin B-like n=1 Tax=Adelges cooleyi TaxID=133065 RepID=UPI0021805D76|nr:cathepsin B-like [Adelges cooleyi]